MFFLSAKRNSFGSATANVHVVATRAVSPMYPYFWAFIPTAFAKDSASEALRAKVRSDLKSLIAAFIRLMRSLEFDA